MTSWHGPNINSKDVLFTRSLDGGMSFDFSYPETVIWTRQDSWGPPDADVIPGFFKVAQFTYLAVDPNNGTIYVVFMDNFLLDGNVDLFLTKSSAHPALLSPFYLRFPYRRS